MDSPLNISGSSLEQFEKNFLLIQDELNDLKLVLSNPTPYPPQPPSNPNPPTSLQPQPHPHPQIPDHPNILTYASSIQSTSLSNLFNNLDLQNPPNQAFTSPPHAQTLTHLSQSPQPNEFDLSHTNIFNTNPLADEYTLSDPKTQGLVDADPIEKIVKSAKKPKVKTFYSHLVEGKNFAREVVMGYGGTLREYVRPFKYVYLQCWQGTGSGSVGVERMMGFFRRIKL